MFSASDEQSEVGEARVGPDIAAVELLDDAVVGEAVGFLQI